MRTEKCMLAQAGDEKQIDQMIASGNWQFTWKWDGERGILKVDEKITLYNRSGKSINTQFPEIVEMASHLPFGVFDGEIYVPSNASNKDKPTTAGRTAVNEADAKLLGRMKPATFKCFDVLEYEGKNVDKPYENRMEIISRISVAGFEPVLPVKNPKDTWKQILSQGDEGMVAKLKGSQYTHNRSPNWLKLKTKIERVLRFNQYEVNTAGALISDGFHRVQVGGVEKAQKVMRWIDLHGNAECEIVGMAVTETGKIRQPVFKRMVGDYE